MADSRTLWVGGLPEQVTEELLYELFLQSGPLEKVTIPKDKEGRNRKFAFVNFKHEESVFYAMQLFEGIRMFGRELRMQTRQGQGSSSVGSTPPHNQSPYASPQYQAQDSRDMYPQQNRGNYHRSSSASNVDNPYQQDSFRSPRERDSRSSDQSQRYERANSWHSDMKDAGGIDQHARHSPQYRPDSGPGSRDSRQSPQYGFESSSSFQNSPQYGHDSRSDTYSNKSPHSDSFETRRQRVLQQQNMSLTMHRQGHDNRSSRRDDRMQPHQRSHSSRRRY